MNIIREFQVWTKDQRRMRPSSAGAAGTDVVFVNPVIESARLLQPAAFDVKLTATGGVSGLVNTACVPATGSSHRPRAGPARCPR